MLAEGFVVALAGQCGDARACSPPLNLGGSCSAARCFSPPSLQVTPRPHSRLPARWQLQAPSLLLHSHALLDCMARPPAGWCLPASIPLAACPCLCGHVSACQHVCLLIRLYVGAHSTARSWFRSSVRFSSLAAACRLSVALAAWHWLVLVLLLPWFCRSSASELLLQFCWRIAREWCW
jgi:hypothetical protein